MIYLKEKRRSCWETTHGLRGWL